MHQAASSATPSQPKLTSGEKTSRSNSDDAGAVQELGVLGVEPVQVERIGEVERPDRAGVRDPRRERAVVPERVEGEHPPCPDVLEAGRPVRGDEGGGRERDQRAATRVIGGSRRRGAPVGRGPAAANRAAARRGRGERERRSGPRGTRIPKAPSSCSRTVRSATAEDGLDQPRGSALPAGQQPPRAARDAGQRQRDRDRGEADDARRGSRRSSLGQPGVVSGSARPGDAPWPEPARRPRTHGSPPGRARRRAGRRRRPGSSA